ncbi:tetratricopeptide repeat protein 19, mitochondrial [Tiliqua scincoides]|uniref:tetratricopeptide repeat protein 19, mitochondrial n=1 Tax=Tiliqua scincoides TaxID=71010 RepID=UPI003461EAF2
MALSAQLRYFRVLAPRLAVATGRRCLTQPRPRPRPSDNRGWSRTRAYQATVGVAAAAFGASLSAFSLFSKEAEKEKEKDVEESHDKETAKNVEESHEEMEKDEEERHKKEMEDTIIFLLKKAKLNIMKGELEEAEKILHESARLSHKADNKAAIIYTYDTMANLAFLRGQLDQAEKLFKAAMSFLLAGGMQQDDNAIIEMSLKLASIYATQDQHKLALAGYEFCILTLEEKIAKQKDLPTDALSEEERIDTRLLLGLSLDSYARYLLAHNRAALAQKMYEQALQIAMEVHGETHPQTIVLMNDLATALDAQGHYDDAYEHVKKASELAHQTEHPEIHIVLNNLAGILMHKEDFSQAREIYKEALKQAEKTGDGASVRHIRKELAELAKKKKQSRLAKDKQERDKVIDD